jgi:peptide/nickel transport system substrate-binding protein
VQVFTNRCALLTLIVLVGSTALVACNGDTKEIEVTPIITQRQTLLQTVVETETVFEKEAIVDKETIIETVVETVTVQATQLPEEPEGERTLVACLGQEPDTLYAYGGSVVTDADVQQAIWDGPIDNRSFSYQPIILEKLPSLADGDAIIEIVSVETGDVVVDSDEDPVILQEGVLVRPAGCYSSECAIEFNGPSIDMEQMVVTFRLMDGILWSDGVPLTAHDSVYAFDLQSDPDTPTNKYVENRTASYRAIDDLTAEWIGLPGYRDSAYYTHFWRPLPQHIWAEFTPLELLDAEESSRRPLGWGPYVIDEWIAGDHITVSKNPLYWRADEGLPKFDKVVFRFVGEDANANIAAMLAGDCDIVDQTGRLEDQIALLLELQAADKINPIFATRAEWEHADFGVNPYEYYDRPDFFEDVRVRRAIAHCMDRQAVVDTVFFGQTQVIDTFVPPSHPLFNPDATHYEFDIDKSIALLEEVGWVDDDNDPNTPRIAQGVEGVLDGTALEFSYWTTTAPQRQQATQLLKSTLAECGISINLEYWNPTEYFANGPDGPVFGRHFDMVQFAFLSGVEPPCWYYTSQQITGPLEEGYCGWGCTGDTGWSDPEYDLVCKKAMESLPGTPEYEQFHQEAQILFAEFLPVVPLYLRLKLAATRPDMKGFIIDPTESSEFWNIEEFDIAY